LYDQANTNPGADAKFRDMHVRAARRAIQQRAFQSLTACAG
jgi:hypothetical protein